MQPLLRIQTIPISVEYKVKRAALEFQSQPASVNITRSKGARNIQTTPARVNIDTFEARASAGLKSARRSVEEYSNSGIAAAQEATRTFAEEGNGLMDSHGAKSAIADMVTARMIRPPQTMMTFIPSSPPEISATQGSISFDFSMDKLTFDWNINHKPQLEYVPGSIEFTVSQYPEVIIEYIGSPIYAPPSADPNYEPPPGIDTSV